MLVLKEFHRLSQDLLLWLASAESRRQKAQVASPEADRQAFLECQEELWVSVCHRTTSLSTSAGPSFPKRSGHHSALGGCDSWAQAAR